jgi:hypothetical protein
MQGFWDQVKYQMEADILDMMYMIATISIEDAEFLRVLKFA